MVIRTLTPQPQSRRLKVGNEDVSSCKLTRSSSRVSPNTGYSVRSYSLWKTYCRAGQIPLWQSLPCHAFGPYLPATCVIGLSAADRSVIRISGTQMDQLLRRDSRGQTLDSLCAPAIKPRFERLVSQVFARQSPMSLTLRSPRFGQEAVLTVLPLLDRQRQCRRALAAVDLAEGQCARRHRRRPRHFLSLARCIMPPAPAPTHKRLSRLCKICAAKRAHSPCAPLS